MSDSNPERNGQWSEEEFDSGVLEQLANQLHQAMGQPVDSRISDASIRPGLEDRGLMEQAGSFEKMDESVLSHLAEQLSRALPASSQMSQLGLTQLPSELPMSLPTSTMDLRQLLSDQAAPTVQPVAGTEAATSYYFMPREQVSPTSLASSPNEVFDVGTIRNDFPILHQKIHGKPLIWFDNAATTQKPQSVIDAVSRYYQRDNSNVHRGAHSLAARSTDAYEQAREKVRRFIGASSAEEIIFVRGTTEGINLIAQSWGRKNIGAGDEILLTTLEHHANIVPWQMLAQETDAVLRVVPITNRGELGIEEYGNLLGPKTKLVAFTQVSNALGTILPVDEMITMAHRFGARVLVDGAQSVPHLPINVQQMDADWFVFSGHKLFAPTGVGVVYGKKEVLNDMPPWQGGGNMIENVAFEKTTYATAPTKFEAGTGTLADAVGLGAAIDYLNSIGMERIASYEQSLTQYAAEQLAQIPGLRLIGTAPEKASVLSFVIDGTQPEDVARQLDMEGIAVRAGHHCAQPTMQRYGLTGTVRPSLAFYNTHDEVDAMIAALRRISLA